ncbi:MAG: hypothetical protein RBQ78_06425 [Acholeplasmataceae bacterium]|jgi:uncharacterized Tic20 family protein|nr:hypothetical protein [Acholeplasmataceae bacterium]
MILRKIIAYTILPLIMLFIGVIGIVNPEKVNKSRWISKPFSFKILNKNENTIRTATIVNCICLLIEGIIYSIISIMLWLNKIEITSFETFLLIIITVILTLPFIFIVHFIRFDKNGNLRRNK